MRRIRAACCACAASGHATTPPRSLMKLRRLMPVPRVKRGHRIGLNDYIDRCGNGLRHCNMGCWPMSPLG